MSNSQINLLSAAPPPIARQPFMFARAGMCIGETHIDAVRLHSGTEHLHGSPVNWLVLPGVLAQQMMQAKENFDVPVLLSGLDFMNKKMRLNGDIWRYHVDMVQYHQASTVLEQLSVPASCCCKQNAALFDMGAGQMTYLSNKIGVLMTQLSCPLMLSTPPVSGTVEDALALVEFLNLLTAQTGSKISVNLSNIHMTCQATGCAPKRLLEAFWPEQIGMIELGGIMQHDCVNLQQAEGQTVCHNVWVLLTHLLELVGLRPSFVDGAGSGVAFDHLAQEVMRLQSRLNAQRNLGPQLGADHSIYK